MRFIFNFIFFGILFYVIWLIFPDAFKVLVSWADHVVLFLKNLILGIWNKLQPYWSNSNSVPKPQSVPALLIPFLLAYWRVR
jgi:hypothetical protein